MITVTLRSFRTFDSLNTSITFIFLGLLSWLDQKQKMQTYLN